MALAAAAAAAATTTSSMLVHRLVNERVEKIEYQMVGGVSDHYSFIMSRKNRKPFEPKAF
jgi:hypothetical protein